MSTTASLFVLAVVVGIPVALCILACMAGGRADALNAAAAPESAPVPPRATTCDAHRPHKVGVSQDGTEWVCVRCDERWPRDVPADPFDQYAAELIAETEAELRKIAEAQA